MQYEALEEKTVSNPHQFVYNVYNSGQEINIFAYDRMVRDFYSMTQKKLLLDTCKVNNSIAISSSLLKRSQKERYKNKRVYVGRNVYYVFSKTTVPLDIFLIVRDMEEEEKHIYDIWRSIFVSKRL